MGQGENRRGVGQQRCSLCRTRGNEDKAKGLMLHMTVANPSSPPALAQPGGSTGCAPEEAIKTQEKGQV